MTLSRRSLILSASVLPLLSQLAAAESVVNVYSYRQPELIEPLLAGFTAKTGIAVRTIFADKGLVERIAQEGENSPADVLLTADAGRLVEASARGILQSVDSAAIASRVPENLRDPGGEWFGLTMRARVFYVSNERVKETAIAYEDLAKPEWKGRVCLRPGNHPYNLGLIAFMIAKTGEDNTRAWLTALKGNLAVKPNGNDRSQAKSVYSGECDLAIANTYYLGVMLTNDKEPEQKDWAKSVRLVFPSSGAAGTHVNISGMALARHAPNRENAVKLMEYLASDEVQRLYAEGNFEYPVNPAVPASEIVRSWGEFRPDPINVAEVAKHEPVASKLVDEVGFND